MAHFLGIVPARPGMTFTEELEWDDDSFRAELYAVRPTISTHTRGTGTELTCRLDPAYFGSPTLSAPTRDLADGCCGLPGQHHDAVARART
ncbi:hypothetical protein [Actinoplanes sp. NPDC048796]|uniref:hypothetical protein n=1 Tax=Actinoplanes sp. NPDC048796 TaxID=3155640 RepID=UPI00340A55F3